MDELQKQGGKLVYDPEFVVHRRPRPTLKAFCKMLLNYGRGRAEQFRLHPTPGSILNFIPPLFCLYLVLLPLLTLCSKWFLVPLALYAVAVIAQTVALVSTHGAVRAIVAFPLQIATHLFYGIGFWRGLFTNLSRPAATRRVDVSLETIPL